MPEDIATAGDAFEEVSADDAAALEQETAGGASPADVVIELDGEPQATMEMTEAPEDVPDTISGLVGHLEALTVIGYVICGLLIIQVLLSIKGR